MTRRQTIECDNCQAQQSRAAAGGLESRYYEITFVHDGGKFVHDLCDRCMRMLLSPVPGLAIKLFR